MYIFWSIFWKIVSILITLLVILPWVLIAVLPVTLTLGSFLYFVIKTITTSKNIKKSIFKNKEIEVFKNIDYREVDAVEREFRPLNLDADLEENYTINIPQKELEKKQKANDKGKTINVPMKHQKAKHKNHTKEDKTMNS